MLRNLRPSMALCYPHKFMLRVGVIGLGGVADRIHLPACKALPGLKVLAGCDPNEDARKRMAAKFGVAPVFATVEELLDAVRPDFVIVGTPPGSHAEICSKALHAGAHVFCEKPFMATLEEADRVIELAREKNLLLRVNNQYRFMTIYRETKKRLDRGEFGRAFYLQCWQQMFHPPSYETNWRNQLKDYAIYEFGTHALDLITYFFDAMPESIQAHTPRGRPEFDADVIVNMALRFPGERMAVCSFNRVSHAPEKYLEMRLDCEEASIRLSLGGVARFSVEKIRHGGLSWKLGLVKGGQARAERKGRSRVFASVQKGEFATATAEHLKYFVEKMKEPERSLDGAEHGRDVLRMVFDAYKSARSGETVRWTPVSQSV